MPSKRESSARVDYVPALCTTARRSYRLGVLVKCSDWQKRVATPTTAEKFIKPSHLEEGEVVTRFP